MRLVPIEELVGTLCWCHLPINYRKKDCPMDSHCLNAEQYVAKKSGFSGRSVFRGRDERCGPKNRPLAKHGVTLSFRLRLMMGRFRPSFLPGSR
ncbi:hypothetical protein JOD01_002735 [Brevibacillus fulvus]|uniref:Uncharacterized protein n=1 Tax=Brevibacillus fulvus TaxID=1125967 RepID=A0A939BV50_9BACL|nr:hypothetical protein [Brevibacillus fulvus]